MGSGNAMTQRHKYWIVAALVVTTVRLLSRSTFVIASESALIIPMVCSAVLCILILVQLWNRGGCSAIILYFLIETTFVMIYWLLLIFVMDTSQLCY